MTKYYVRLYMFSYRVDIIFVKRYEVSCKKEVRL